MGRAISRVLINKVNRHLSVLIESYNAMDTLTKIYYSEVVGILDLIFFLKLI